MLDFRFQKIENLFSVFHNLSTTAKKINSCIKMPEKQLLSEFHMFFLT